MNIASEGSKLTYPYQSEMISVWLAGWISSRIVSFQADTDIHKLLSGNWIRIRISDQKYISLLISWRKLHITQSFIYYLRKHLFIFLRRSPEYIYTLNYG